MVRKFGPFDTSQFYEVENRRLQRALAQASVATGFAVAGQGAVTAGTGAQLIIAAYPDGALVDGLYVENPASETVTLTTNTGSTNPRIDRLVMRLDMTAKTIAPFQIVGTPAASPQIPPLVKTANVVDMPLVRYTMPGSASAQNPGSIVDERVLSGGLTTTPLPLAATYTATGAPWGPPLLVQDGAKMSTQGSVTNSTSSYKADAGIEYLIATLPPGTEPASPVARSVAFGNGSSFAGATVIVRPDRTVKYVSHTGVNIVSVGQLSLGLAGVEWVLGI